MEGPDRGAGGAPLLFALAGKSLQTEGFARGVLAGHLAHVPWRSAPHGISDHPLTRALGCSPRPSSRRGEPAGSADLTCGSSSNRYAPVLPRRLCTWDPGGSGSPRDCCRQESLKGSRALRTPGRPGRRSQPAAEFHWLVRGVPSPSPTSRRMADATDPGPAAGPKPPASPP